MRKPPITIGIVGAIFLALGCLDLYRGLAPLFQAVGPAHLASDDVQVLLVGLAALAGGAFVLMGHNWARWLLVAWMALHTVIRSGDPVQLLAHVAIFGVIAFLLFRPGTAPYFRGRAAA